MFLNRRSQVDPMPCTTKTTWSMCGGSPKLQQHVKTKLKQHVISYLSHETQNDG